MIFHFLLERETKGAVRYMEVADSVSNTPVPIGEGAKIGTLYIRKAAWGYGEGIPARIKITVE